ncbi:MAG: NADP-dependent isocitrate dehydrogenase, partial [Chlamydiia bacterium]|nr:NADP-dependent isocitrate dehydrogenase [Chlamydiia bacterium]
GGASHSVESAQTQAMAAPTKKALVGLDVFVESNGNVKALQEKLEGLNKGGLKLTMISNRGARMWPGDCPETSAADTWRCRFQNNQKGAAITHGDIVKLLGKLADGGVDFTQTEHLYTFDGHPGYSLSADEQ